MKILAIKNMQQHAPVLQSPPLLSLSTSLSNSAQFLLGQRSCGASSNNVDLKSGTQVFSQSTPKEVAEEICKHFKNCLPHNHGESELHRAAFKGDAETICLLLKQINSDPYKYQTINQRNRLGCTPIRLAATGGHLDCLTHLIDAGANINTIDVKCQTPLFVAVKNRRLDCARKLLQAGAHPDGDVGNSSTPLYVAFMNRDTDYVLLLLEYGAHPDKLHHKISNHNMYNPKLTSLNAAVDYMLGDDNMYQTVRALLIRGCETENFCLHERYFYGMEQLINLLYNFGVQVNVNYHGLWMKDLAGRYSTSQRVMLLQGTPRSLLSACRIVIISCLPRPRRDLNVLDHLPLPSSLIAYLKFCDV